jgi:hypothetical protein
VHEAERLKVEVGVLGLGLGTIADTVKKADEAGNSATITHSQSNAFGRTEVIIGNTDTAARGKLSRSQTGLKDYSLHIVVIAAVVLIALVAVLAH